MIYLQIVLSSIFAVIVLFLLSKLIGARQISQMSMFDYINGITIGSIAAEAAISKGQDVLEPMAAMIIFGLATLLLSVAADKSIVLRRFITGRPVFLMKRGKLFKESMKKAKVDMSELQTMCRNQGYFDLSQIESIIFEPNGTVSILPVSSQKPAPAADAEVQVPQEKIPANIIIDGKILNENLKNIGRDENWLSEQLKKQNLKSSEIFLAVCSDDGQLKIFEYERDNGKDIFS